MKNALAKYFLGFFGAIGALLAGLAGYQQVCLRMARKKKDETHVMETYHAKEGKLHIAPWGTASLWFWYTA